MWTLIAGLLVAAVTGLVSYYNNQSTNDTNERIAREANETNVKLSEQNSDLQQKLVQQQNEYNTPKNQISRLVDAGLNRNLAYGQVNSGNQSSVANPSAPVVSPWLRERADFSQFSQASQMLADMRLKQAQTNKLNAETSKVGTDIAVGNATALHLGKTDELTEQQIVNLKKQAVVIDNTATLTNEQVLKTRQEIENLKAQGRNLDVQTLRQEIAAQYDDASFQAQIKKAWQDIATSKATEKMTLQQFTEAVKTLPLRLLGYEKDLSAKDIDIQNKFLQNYGLTLQNGQLRVDLIYSEKDYQNTVGWYNNNSFWNGTRNVLGSIGSLISGATRLLK